MDWQALGEMKYSMPCAVEGVENVGIVRPGNCMSKSVYGPLADDTVQRCCVWLAVFLRGVGEKVVASTNWWPRMSTRRLWWQKKSALSSGLGTSAMTNFHWKGRELIV